MRGSFVSPLIDSCHNMFKIDSIAYLTLLLIIPVIYGVYYFLKLNAVQLWSRLGISNQLKKSWQSNSALHRTKFILFLSILFLLIIALANPQFGLKKEKVKTQNTEIFIALDISQSMMGSDIKPNRLLRSKLLIKQLLEHFRSDRIGLITFAGEAYLQSPLTTDMATIQLLSNMIETHMASTPGTSLSAAIELARKSFPDKEGFHKMLILITDGEDHEGEAIEQAKLAAKEGISIVTIPIGTEEGSYIPNQEATGESFKRDNKGNLVKTIPNRKLLSEIADVSSGTSLEIDQGDALFEQLTKRVQLMAKKDVTFQSFNEYQSYFQWPLGIAILLLIIDCYLIYKKRHV